MSNSYNEIIKNRLYVGDYETAKDLTILEDKLGVTHIVACGFDSGYFEDLRKFQYFCIDITDSPSSNLLRFLPRAVKFIQKAFNEHGNAKSSTTNEDTNSIQNGVVYVHCVHGQSRSCAVCVAYLILYALQHDTIDFDLLNNDHDDTESSTCTNSKEIRATAASKASKDILDWKNDMNMEMNMKLLHLCYNKVMSSRPQMAINPGFVKQLQIFCLMKSLSMSTIRSTTHISTSTGHDNGNTCNNNIGSSSDSKRNVNAQTLIMSDSTIISKQSSNHDKEEGKGGKSQKNQKNSNNANKMQLQLEDAGELKKEQNYDMTMVMTTILSIPPKFVSSSTVVQILPAHRHMPIQSRAHAYFRSFRAKSEFYDTGAITVTRTSKFSPLIIVPGWNDSNKLQEKKVNKNSQIRVATTSATETTFLCQKCHEPLFTEMNIIYEWTKEQLAKLPMSDYWKDSKGGLEYQHYMNNNSNGMMMNKNHTFEAALVQSTDIIKIEPMEWMMKRNNRDKHVSMDKNIAVPPTTSISSTHDDADSICTSSRGSLLCPNCSTKLGYWDWLATKDLVTAIIVMKSKIFVRNSNNRLH